MRSSVVFAACIATCFVAACAHALPQRAPNCCATIGSTRQSVESVFGPPSPPQGSKWHPLPSPPPNSPIYTTEHGYVNVTYSGSNGVATRFSTDFYEGKAPSDAFAIVSAYLPKDAVDTKSSALGPKVAIRVFKSASVAKRWPKGQGLIYVECLGPQPSMLCYKEDVLAVGTP